MRVPRGRKHGQLGPYSYHFSDSELRDAVEIVNRGDCLYSVWRPEVIEDTEEKEMKKEWPKTRR